MVPAPASCSKPSAAEAAPPPVSSGKENKPLVTEVAASTTATNCCPAHPGQLGKEMATDSLPVVDLAPFLSSGDTSAAREVARSLVETGCLVVRDPRVQQPDNESFLDTMERYFAQPTEVKLQDTRPELSYQVGATPEGVERPRILSDRAMREEVQRMPQSDRPELPSGADVKWRFFWRVGPRPTSTAFPELNAHPVVPRSMPGWAQQMDHWGTKMLDTADVVARLAALGLGLGEGQLADRMEGGPHLLAPTGVDLDMHGGRVGTVYAGYHYDLNLLTIHGKSRYPGLYVWLRDGRKVAVRIPDGCLLLQAGKQLEWLTGGEVRAGMHSVVCTEATQAAAREARAAGRPCWRVSSTVFAHVASDQVLQPLGRFATRDALAAYPPTPAGEYVQQELRAISLSSAE